MRHLKRTCDSVSGNSRGWPTEDCRSALGVRLCHGRLVYPELLVRAGALPSSAFYHGQGSSRHNQWYDLPHRVHCSLEFV